MIISDMLEFGLLTTLPVVILVTGDRGFSYPCKRLVDNRCKVILVTTDASSGYNSLKDSVDVVIDYRTELLRLPSRQRSVVSISRCSSAETDIEIALPQILPEVLSRTCTNSFKFDIAISSFNFENASSSRFESPVDLRGSRPSSIYRRTR